MSRWVSLLSVREASWKRDCHIALQSVQNVLNLSLWEASWKLLVWWHNERRWSSQSSLSERPRGSVTTQEIGTFQGSSQSSLCERPRGSMLQLVATVKSGSTVPFSVESLCICLVVLQLVATPYRLSFLMSSNAKPLWNSEYELKLYSHLPCLSRFPPRQTEVML